MVHIAIDTPQGKVRLYCLYNNGCQIDLINQDIACGFNLPVYYVLYSRKHIARFLNSNLLYASHEYNRGPVVIGKELPV